MAVAAWLGSLSASAVLAQGRPAARVIEADRIIAVVNNEVVTAHELRARVATVERQLRQQGTQMPPRDVLEKHVLERLIVDRAQLQFAKETGLQIDDAQLDQTLARIAEGNRMGLAQFRASLERDGIAWSKFREDIRDEMVIGRLREREVDSKIVVTEGEIDNFLQTAGAMGSEEFNLAHILLRVPEQAKPEQLARLQARAEEIIAQLRRGADFGQLAASHSDAPDGLSGGLMGWRSVERLPTLFAEAVAKLKPGEISDVLRSPAGYHILKLLDRRGGAIKAQPVEQTRARHILIKTSELVSEAEARRRLADLKDRLAHGGDFAELARLHSNDLSASKGGDLGWLNPGDTVPDFEQAMNRLKPGEVGEPVKSPFGWHLIQVLERRTDVSQERVRQSARMALRERKADEAYQDWLRQLRDRAYVEYRLEDNR
ncbi:MAG: peptidylprolyl isomerase [Rhodocyclaceae bacterium]|nr:peptidylprolyl isomerase [Rhodocyclaceae bacterium]MCL4682103.1 peptidylprolyl isomerase [Rhodocyclaceae bacterium]